jgi:hypothetical protein
MTKAPALGPIALCTLVTRDGQASVEAYTRWMHQQLSWSGPLPADTAAATGLGELAGNRSWLLSNKAGRQWLHIVEWLDAPERDALNSFGWMAMETLVENVDQLAASLEGSPFELLRPPADLDVSDKIRACQARGPAGEILYLTQVSGEVPPFELPTCQAPVDHLFIPVLSTPSRDCSLADYSGISGNQGINFDTRITVVNQARGFELERRHPVATLQLAGQALIEIDQIADTAANDAGICSGMASIAFHCSAQADNNALPQSGAAFSNTRASAHTGTAGESFTLIYS